MLTRANPVKTNVYRLMGGASGAVRAHRADLDLGSGKRRRYAIEMSLGHIDDFGEDEAAPGCWESLSPAGGNANAGVAKASAGMSAPTPI